MYLSNRCVQCGQCLRACPESVISRPGSIGRERCTYCGKCVEACPQGALRIAGEKKRVKEIIDEVAKDEPFYRRSGGGLTLSGGEPAAQPNFSYELLKAARRAGFNTAIETSGCASSDVLAGLAEMSDYVLYDLKQMDKEKHRKLIGEPNELILENLRNLSKSHAHIIIRIPVIPGLNDDEQNLQDTADFINALGGGIKRIECLPFHQYGRAKYEMLGMHYELSELENAATDTLERVVAFLDNLIPGVRVTRSI